MTKEEALKYWLPIIRHTVKGTEVYEESLDMAIKALAKEECDDCVSRQAVLAIAGDSCLDLESNEDTRKFCDEIKKLPSVTPQQKMGRWIDEKDGYGTSCSECGKWYPHSILTKQEVLYCCSCGAKMQEVEE